MESKKDIFYSRYLRNKAVNMLKSNNWIVLTYSKYNGYKFNNDKIYCYIAVKI